MLGFRPLRGELEILQMQAHLPHPYLHVASYLYLHRVRGSLPVFGLPILGALGEYVQQVCWGAHHIIPKHCLFQGLPSHIRQFPLPLDFGLSTVP